jgi:hypothetical protein
MALTTSDITKRLEVIGYDLGRNHPNPVFISETLSAIFDLDGQRQHGALVGLVWAIIGGVDERIKTKQETACEV